jgi:hypothetical protein
MGIGLHVELQVSWSWPAEIGEGSWKGGKEVLPLFGKSKGERNYRRDRGRRREGEGGERRNVPPLFGSQVKVATLHW